MGSMRGDILATILTSKDEKKLGTSHTNRFFLNELRIYLDLILALELPFIGQKEHSKRTESRKVFFFCPIVIDKSSRQEL